MKVKYIMYIYISETALVIYFTIIMYYTLYFASVIHIINYNFSIKKHHRDNNGWYRK